MSFAKAKKCFDENKSMIGEPMADPKTFNLNQGLSILANEIDDEFKKNATELRHINEKLDSLRSAVRAAGPGPGEISSPR
jgi:hypothetical protein